MAVRFDTVRSIQPQHLADSWELLKAKLFEHVERSEKMSGPLWSPVNYRRGATRGLRGVESVSCFVADLDGETFSDDLRARLAEYEYLAYTTWSHAPDAEHWHLVMPLSTEVPATHWGTAWSSMHKTLGIIGDEACKDASRIYFMPQHAPQASYIVVSNPGQYFTPPADNPLQRAERHAKITPHPNHTRQAATYSWQDEAWWNEPADLSRFDGLTKLQGYALLIAEWNELTQ